MNKNFVKYKTPEQASTEISNANWFSLWSQIVLYTDNRVALMFCNDGLGASLKNTVQSKDVAKMALLQALAGDEPWPIDYTIERLLLRATDGILNRIARNAKNTSSFV